VVTAPPLRARAGAPLEVERATWPAAGERTDVGVPMVAPPAAPTECCGVILLSLPFPRETRASFEIPPSGAWTLPVGGDAAAILHARMVLERLAARVERVGEVGAGHTVKLLKNLMFAAINVATAEAIAACDTLGLDPARFVALSLLERDVAATGVLCRM
jgi:hypothetical protein